MGLKLDTSDFESALNSYQEATGKDAKDILNKAALNFAYRAAQFTVMETAAQIQSDLLKDPKILYALVSLSLKKRGIGTLAPAEFQKEVQAFIQRRKGSARYLRVGWAQAIIDLGGSFRGSRLERGSHSFANPAVADLLATVAWIVDETNEHKAETAEDKVWPVLQEALDFVANDMETFAQDKLAKTAAKYSA
jgi:hypothetical protein